MNAEGGTLIKTGVNEQMLLVNQRSERALIEREYQKLAKVYAGSFTGLADTYLAEKITSEMDAEQIAAIDRLLVYKFGRTAEFGAYFPLTVGSMAVGGLMAFFVGLGTQHYLTVLLSCVVVGISVACQNASSNDCRVSEWLVARRKLWQLQGVDFSPYDALHQ